MTVAQWGAVIAIGVWALVAAVLFIQPDRRYRHAGWGAVGLSLFAAVAVSITLWGPHAGEYPDEPGGWHTAPLKP